MIVSMKILTSTPRRLGASVLALAMVLLPVGVAHGQDYAAVERRLAAAVAKGEISKAQAEVMLAALKKSAGKDAGRDLEKARALRERYAEGERRIMEAVKQGKATREQAEERLGAMREAMFGSGDKKGSGETTVDMLALRQRYGEGAAKIKEAVKNGKLTEAEAEQKLLAMREQLFGSGDKDGRGSEERIAGLKRRYAEGERRIKEAVKLGKLTEAEAEQKLIAMRKELFGVDGLKRRYAEGARRIKEAIKQGKLTKEQAQKKLDAMRKQLIGADDEDGHTETKGSSSKNTETKGTSSEHTESSTQESRMVIELVISGMKTQADADEVLDDLEGVSHVLEVKVDLKTGKAKVLMDEDIELSDAAKKIMALVDALPRGYSSNGYSFDYRKVGLLKEEWSWKRGW